MYAPSAVVCFGVDVPTMASNPIDLERLEDFTAGDPDLERELSSLFLSAGERYLMRMQDAISSGAVDWSGACHALKGASGNIGAHEVAHLARSFEHDPPQSDHLEKLRSAFDEALSFLRRRLQAHGLDLPQTRRDECSMS